MATEPQVDYVLRLADACLVHGQRLAEWCGHAPVLEEDIALANIALDHIGQALAVHQAGVGEAQHVVDLRGRCHQMWSTSGGSL